VQPYETSWTVPPRTAAVELYQWDDRAESAQAERYMQYLQKCIGSQDRYVWLVMRNVKACDAQVTATLEASTSVWRVCRRHCPDARCTSLVCRSSTLIRSMPQKVVLLTEQSCFCGRLYEIPASASRCGFFAVSALRLAGRSSLWMATSARSMRRELLTC
jgi:hypothetical protein